MSSIRCVSTALPKQTFGQESVMRAAEGWLADRPESLAMLKRFVQSARTNERYLALNFEELLQLNGLQHRAELFEEIGVRFGSESLTGALHQADLDPERVACHIFTSCTCPTIPSIDGVIMEKAGLRRTIQRIPVYQYGCAGGVIGLALASKFAPTMGTVALTSVELCSLVFYPNDPSPSQLVGTAIFGDGAASVIVDGGDEGLVYVASESYLIPNSRHLMGYDTFDDGFHLRLDKTLPQQLALLAPGRVKQFLKQHGLVLDDIQYWLFHPGSLRILESLEESLCGPEKSYWAKEVLNQVGNLSSASVLFVLKRFLDSKVVKSGDRVVMLGVGPGLTIELILFEYR